MKLQIERVAMNYEGGVMVSVQVHFSARDEARTNSFSGHVQFSAEEYFGNESLPVLESLVRNKATELLQTDDAE